MKHLFKSIFAIAAAAMTIASCVKEEPFQNDNSQNVDMVTFEVNADSDPTTKTHLAGKTAIRWNQTGEEITVLEYTGKTKTVGTAPDQKTVDDFAYAASSTATVSANGETATFTVTLPEDKISTSFDYWGFYPSLNFVEKSDFIENFRVQLPDVQTPKAETFDPNADLLISSPVHQESQPTEALSFRFHRPISVVELTLVGIREGEKISTVTFSNSTAALAGRSYYNLKTNQYTEIGYTNQHKTEISLNCGDRSATGNDVIYFTTFPANLNDVTIDVNTDKATYSYSKGSLAKPIVLQEGHKFPLTVKNLVRKENVVDEYILLTKDYTLAEGDKVLLASGAKGDVRLLGAQASKRRETVPGAKVTGNKITTLPQGTCVLTLEAGAEPSTFALADYSSAEVSYLHASGEKSTDLKSKNQIVQNSSWTVEVTTEGKIFFKNVAYAKSTRRICLNSSNNEFGFYTPGKSYLVSIFYQKGKPKTALPAPVKVTATLAKENSNSVKVEWTPVTDAGSYTVSCEGVSKKVEGQTSSSATIDNLPWNKTVVVTVVANPATGDRLHKSSTATSSNEVIIGANPNPNTGTEEKIIGTFEASSDKMSTKLTTESGISIHHEKGTASFFNTKYNTPSTLRFYGGNTLTFSGKLFKKIELVYLEGYEGMSITVKGGNITRNTTAKTITWEGESSNVIFTNGISGDQQFRTSAIKVTYL